MKLRILIAGTIFLFSWVKDKETMADQVHENVQFKGHNSWEYLEAGETSEKSYLVCILQIGKNKT